MILRFLGGKYASAEFPIGAAPIRIGRDPALEMVLHDDAVDPTHARITVDAHGVWVEDLGGASGTYVNDARIVGRVVLAAGDRIAIAGHVMELRGA